MWSSWAWVRTTPTTRSGSSASQAKSGRMMSTPGWSASGKARPQSISSRAPFSSTTAQLRPISPSPPRKAIRVVPGAAGGRLTSTSVIRLQSRPGQQAAGELDLVRGGVDQRRAQRAGGQAEQVHARLEQDRAGGGEQALEQLQVTQVQVQGGRGVAPLEGPDQLLEGGADQVGGHADHPDPADGQQREEVLVVARVLLQLPAGLAVEAAGRGHVADRVLDRDHVVELLEQPGHGRHLDGAGGPAGDVVEHAGQPGGAGDGREMGHKAALGRLVVVRGDQQQRPGPGLLGQVGELDRLGGGVGRGAAHHPVAAGDLDDRGPQAGLLVGGQGGRLAGGAGHDQGVGAVVEQVAGQALGAVDVQVAVRAERGGHGGEHTTKATWHGGSSERRETAVTAGSPTRPAATADSTRASTPNRGSSRRPGCAPEVVSGSLFLHLLSFACISYCLRQLPRAGEGVRRMAELLVIPSELERAAGRLQASADQVRSVVGGLLPAVALGGAALGDAALFDRFHAMWTRWATELGVLADDLTGAAGRLQAAAAEYRSTDQAAVPPPSR